MHKRMFILILTSIILGVACGIVCPQEVLAIRWVGTVFINLLKLISLPLIFCALVSAVTSMGNMKRLGPIGIYTVGYVLLSVSIAVLIGLVLLNVFQPGQGVPSSFIFANATPADLTPLEFSSFLLKLFPSNIIEAAAKFEIMTIVLFSIVFAIACLSAGETAKPVIELFTGLRNVFVKMIIWLMYLTPFGLFSLLGAAVAEASLQNRLLESVGGMLFFILIFLGGLLFQVLWQLLLVQWVIKKSSRQFLSSASNAMLVAFATSSSMATLPVTLIVAKEQEVSDEVARFVLPLATTINLAGTAMYEAVSALFFCQILGMHLSILSQVGVFLTAIVAGMGATGIPEGGLVTMIMVLRSVNVPTSAIALLLPFDRILDRFRTMTNVWGDLVCAVTVDHLAKFNNSKQANRSLLSELSESTSVSR